MDEQIRMSSDFSMPEHLAKLVKLREEGLFCDVEVCCHGRCFMAHKCVLAAASPHFMRLLTEEKNCGRFSLPRHVTPEAFGRALHFMYTGSLPAADSNEPLALAQLHSTASYLRLPALSKLCANALLASLRPRNALELRSQVTDSDGLMDGIDEYIVRNLTEILDLADCPLPRIKVDLLVGSQISVSAASIGDLLRDWFARVLHRLILDSRERRHCGRAGASSDSDASYGEDTDSSDDNHRPTPSATGSDENGEHGGNGSSVSAEFCQTALAQRLLSQIASQVQLLYLLPDGSSVVDCDQRQLAAAVAEAATATAAASDEAASNVEEATLELANHLPQMRDYIDSRRRQAKIGSNCQRLSTQLPSRLLAVLNQQHQPGAASCLLLLVRLGPALCLMSVCQLPVAEDPLLREHCRVRRRSSAQSSCVSFHSSESGEHFPYMLSPRAAFGAVRLLANPGPLADWGQPPLLVVGGYNRGQCLRSCEIYSPESVAWRSGPDLATGPRSRFAAAAVANDGGFCRVFACGGSDGVCELATVEEFEGTKWLAGPTMSHARSGCAVAELNGVIYAVGGRSGAVSVRHAEFLDPRVGRWQAMPAMAVPRNECCMSAYQGQLWVAGGSGGWSGGCLSSLEIWDPRTRCWNSAPKTSAFDVVNSSHNEDDLDNDNAIPSQLLSLACPRRGAAMASLSSADLWIVGGSDGHQPALSSCENLAAVARTPLTSSALAAAQLAVPRAGLGLLPLSSDSLLALGGFSGRVFLDSAEILRLA